MNIAMTCYSILCISMLSVLNYVHGRPPSRIISGEEVNGDEFKYVASLQYQGSHICGGAIIDTTHIVLAGHCVYKTPKEHMTVVAGVTRLDDKTAITRKVTKVHLHTNYHPPRPTIYNLQDDIAVITLESPLPLSSNITLLNLPEADVKYGTVGTIAGWGSVQPFFSIPVNQLQKTTETILGPIECYALKAKHGAGGFCARNEKLESSVCTFDSGSPFVSENTLLGITSVSACDPVTYPDIYVKVFHYLSFIKEALRD